MAPDLQWQFDTPFTKQILTEAILNIKCYLY